jgi:hypothetical protein
VLIDDLQLHASSPRSRFCSSIHLLHTAYLHTKTISPFAVLQVLIDDLQLHGQLTAQQFLQQREEILDRLFPNSPLMPGEPLRLLQDWMYMAAAAAAAEVAAVGREEIRGRLFPSSHSCQVSLKLLLHNLTAAAAATTMAMVAAFSAAA